MLSITNYHKIYEYINRIGRTGRVGNKGRSTSFCNKKIDGHLATDLADSLQRVRQRVPDFLKECEHLTRN